MRDAWDRNAAVEGMIRREMRSGRPVDIRQISRVVVLDGVDHEAFQRAAGSLEIKEPRCSMDEALRRVRNQWYG